MSRKEKIELLINLINQLQEKDRDEIIALISYTAQIRGHHPDLHQKADQ